MTQREVIYVTKMKKNLRYTGQSDVIWQTPAGLMKHGIWLRGTCPVKERDSAA